MSDYNYWSDIARNNPGDAAAEITRLRAENEALNNRVGGIDRLHKRIMQESNAEKRSLKQEIERLKAECTKQERALRSISTLTRMAADRRVAISARDVEEICDRALAANGE